MSFVQRLFRRFSKKQEIETPKNQQNRPEPLGGDTKSKDDATLDDITLDDTNPDDASLNDDAIFDDANLQADAESKINIKSEADVETEVNVEADTEPEVNVNQEDDSDSESVPFLWENRVSKDAELNQESNLKAIQTHRLIQRKTTQPRRTQAYILRISHQQMVTWCLRVGMRRTIKISRSVLMRVMKSIAVTYITWLTYTSISSPLSLTANATPQPPLTFQPLTPAASSTSFSSHKKDEASPFATSEPPTAVGNPNSLKTQPMTYLTSEKVFDRAQIADQPRIPWIWSVSSSKNRALYEPTAVGKWWWAWAQDNRDDKRIITNIARIMETELGEQRFGKEKCTRCQKEGLECWIYVDKAEYQVVFAGSACARCRAVPRAMGCSLAIRGKKRRTSPLPPPPPRLLLPKGGYPPVYTGPDTGLEAPAVQAGRPKRTRK